MPPPSPVVASAASSFLSTFRAADPQWQDWCTRALNGSAASAAQHGQDVFVFWNLFARHADSVGATHFSYVDSGANDWHRLSNTFLFDKCLGWEGVCVEPGPQYFASLRTHRSCRLVTECLSSSASTVDFEDAGVNGHVKPQPGHPASLIQALVGRSRRSSGAGGGSNATTTATRRVRCNPLHTMLRENYAGGGADPWRSRRVTVDFWSLDVEGLELFVLDALDVSKVHVRSLLVEDFWQANRQLDYLLARKGFVKAHQMAADSLYVSTSDSSALLPPDGRWWYPKGFHRQWEANTKWRRHVKRTEPHRFPEDLRR